ncbi:MAG: glycosyltransferase [Terracidiphilus sp.]
MSRIAVLIPTLDRLGGAERQVMQLAKGLARRGWCVTVLALSGTGGAAAQELIDAGVEFMSLRMRKGLADPRGWWGFHRWLVQKRPALVHAHMPHSAWLARWSRPLGPSFALVDTIHTSSVGTLGCRLGYRLSDQLTDQVTVVSRAAATSYLDARMVSKHHLQTLPNGIDTEHWRPDATLRFAIRKDLRLKDEFLWLAAGRLETVKNYPILLRAFQSLMREAQLVIAGAGSLDGALRKLAQELEISNRVHFLGFETDVRRWMQAADGFALTSLWEGLPVALLEAASCGLPAVATKVPGSWETIEDGRTGLLVNTGDADALAGAMMKLMDTPSDLRQTMGECARQRVKELYGLEQVLDRREALYARIIDGRSSRRCKLTLNRSLQRNLYGRE